MFEIERVEADLRKVVAAASDELEAHRRAKRARHLRTWTQGFATHGSFSGPTAEVAKILGALEPLTKARFAQARTAGEREPHDAYRFDALVTAVTTANPTNTTKTNTSKTNTSNAAACVLVDLGSLLAGTTGPGGVCEIRGCDRDRMLERHHTPPFEQSHRTTYRELGNLCPKHHDLVTNKRYTTTDNHDGTWDLHAPANTPASAPADARANAPPDEAAA